VTGGVPAVRLDHGQDLPGADVDMVAAVGAIQREAGSKNHALEVGEPDPSGISPETFQIVGQARHAGSVTEYGYTRNGFLAASRMRRKSRCDQGCNRPRGSDEGEWTDDGGDPVKTVTVRDLQKKVKACVDGAQADRVIITRHGKPAAVLVGVEGDEWEDALLQTDPVFWKLVRARRKQPTIFLGQLKQRLGLRTT